MHKSSKVVSGGHNPDGFIFYSKVIALIPCGCSILKSLNSTVDPFPKRLLKNCSIFSSNSSELNQLFSVAQVGLWMYAMGSNNYSILSLLISVTFFIWHTDNNK